MKKTQFQSRFSAFTLIELLVVIAIIGILAGLLFPAIQGALQKAIAIKLANSGRSIVLALYSENVDREVLSLASASPSTSASFTGASVNYTTVACSEIYFSDLVESGAIGNIRYSEFAGGGLSPAQDKATFLEGDHNMWSMIAGLDESASDNTPIFFSRNLNLTSEDLKTPAGMQGKLVSTTKPFGNKGVVVVTKGSSVTWIQAKHLTVPQLFFADAVFNTSTNSAATVVAAKTVTK